ncbi:MAG: methionine gamma-lyase family protein [Clostridia bacterium]|nr:methionine gamma-lyase family protein [Clostridia bacterium]
MEFSQQLFNLAAKAEAALADRFADIDRVAFENTQKVMNAFRNFRVSEAMFYPTSGYGYDDRGRDTLDQIWAEVMGAEAAFVRHSIVNGTQALTIGLFGLLRPNDILFSIAGKPYDTLDEVIGNSGNPGNGSLRDFGVEYRQADLLPDGQFDTDSIRTVLSEEGERVKVVFIQRSKGYLNRKTLSVAQIGEIIPLVRSLAPHAYVVVDNCYGEFTETIEPTAVGADMIIGSLIKNPGGGMAETGGYIAGTARAVELASYRLTSVGCGCEVGASLGQNKNMFKGLFYAPHTTAQALKTAHFAAYIFGAEGLGFEVEPKWDEPRHDIIQTVITRSREGLCAFCRGIQAGSPIDSFVTPEPWAMPGYSDQVIMAAGAFTQGASIELSADGPLREPYTAFFQGGLTYESGKIGILSAAKEVMEDKSILTATARE